MKPLEQFFCFSLEATAHFFGWLGGIGSIIVIIVLSCIVENSRVTVELLKHNPDAFRGSSSLPVAGNIWNAITIFIICINFIINVCLVMGTITKREKILLPWLIANPFLVIFLFAYMTCLSFYTNIEPLLIPTTLLLTLNIYLWIAMRSLYVKIQTGNELCPAAENIVETLHSSCLKFL